MSNRPTARIAATLDKLATPLVIVAPVSVIPTSARTWQSERPHTPSDAPLVLTPPGATSAMPPHPLDAETLGRRDAKIVLIEYADFECPYCAQFASDVWPTIKEKYI